MSGLEVVRRIKTDPELRTIPVIVVSVVASENKARLFGTVDVLQKPISREELLAVLHRNLREPRPRVLVVDDDPDIRRLLVSYLQEANAESPHRGERARSPRVAQGILARFDPAGLNHACHGWHGLFGRAPA
jgi:CheY-like chemotaxis protein